jgi:predicted MFS family arabinose efflux permease
MKHPTAAGRAAWMLAVLTAVFALSHAFRTVVAILAGGLTDEFDATPQSIGSVAASFHIAFALAQPVVGVALDRHGPRRTVLVAFVLAVLGSALSAAATSLPLLMAGQWLIGFGCAPALLAAMVFITRRCPDERFAALSGQVFTLGGLGMLITATPLAWVVEHSSWRMGFVCLGLLAAAVWLAVWRWVEAEPAATQPLSATLGTEARELLQIVLQRHTAGICCLAAVSYAAFMALRGLWLGPLFAQRHGFSLVAIGHVAFLMPLAGLLGPALFGLFAPGGEARRRVITGCSLVFAAFFGALALGGSAVLDVALVLLIGLFLGYIVLQYADLRSAYPAAHIGRALSVFTMAMFVGVAGVQWLSGTVASLVASLVAARGGDAPQAALLTVAGLLVAGTLAFWFLPGPRPASPAAAAAS